MSEAEAAPGMNWHEETITDVFLLAAHPFVLFETFSKQREEPAVGADWLWWWADSTEECFGMLVQAKRLHGESGSRNKSIDFRYKKGEQLRRLGEASDAIGVPAMYVLYMGDNDYRLPMTCGEPGHTVSCDPCSRWSVAMITWLLASLVSNSGRDAANAAFNDGFPLEDLADPSKDTAPIDDLNLRNCAPELRTFLTTPQTGARLIAKTVLRAVSAARHGMFSADTMSPTRTITGRVFDDVPADSAHFPRPYLDHVLRGLRRELPPYMQDLRAGLPLPDAVAATVAGVALFTC